MSEPASDGRPRPTADAGPGGAGTGANAEPATGGTRTGALRGRVVVVTGAGRGLGREHALLLAAEGARVVVNDLGCAPDGTLPPLPASPNPPAPPAATAPAGTTAAAAGGVASAAGPAPSFPPAGVPGGAAPSGDAGNPGDPGPAESVVAEIRAAGGAAVASTADVATMAGAKALLATALDAFGEVHALVNNAGILRDRMFVNMSEDEWDGVIRGQLRATFCPTRVFAGYWRDRAKAGAVPDATIVNVPSTSGLIGQAGQTNYGAAKAGIAALTVILAEELARYGIRVNAVTPVARTRMTERLPVIGDLVAAPADPEQFDVYHPGNVSPLVAWLVGAGREVTGRVFYAKGGEIRQFLGWQYGKVISKGSRWTVTELDQEMRDLV